MVMVVQADVFQSPLIHAPEVGQRNGGVGDRLAGIERDFCRSVRLAVSLLEKLTLDYCKGKPVNSSHLVWLISNYRSWPALHRYYYLPICMMLARSLVQDAI